MKIFTHFDIFTNDYCVGFYFNANDLYSWQFNYIPRFDCNFYDQYAQQLPRLFK